MRAEARAYNLETRPPQDEQRDFTADFLAVMTSEKAAKADVREAEACKLYAKQIIHEMEQDLPWFEDFLNEDPKHRLDLESAIVAKLPEALSVYKLYKEAGKEASFDLKQMVQLLGVTEGLSARAKELNFKRKADKETRKASPNLRIVRPEADAAAVVGEQVVGTGQDTGAKIEEKAELGSAEFAIETVEATDPRGIGEILERPSVGFTTRREQLVNTLKAFIKINEKARVILPEELQKKVSLYLEKWGYRKGEKVSKVKGDAKNARGDKMDAMGAWEARQQEPEVQAKANDIIIKMETEDDEMRRIFAKDREYTRKVAMQLAQSLLEHNPNMKEGAIKLKVRDFVKERLRHKEDRNRLRGKRQSPLSILAR